MRPPAPAPPERPQFYWRGLHVPYIAPWSAEAPLPGQLIRRYGKGMVGLGYADEQPSIDRQHGALWVRHGVARGRGEPLLAGVHPRRQPQAMSHLLCQVCGSGTFDRLWRLWGERHLFIVRARPGVVVAEGEITDTPPVCLRCAMESIGACPRLRQGWAAALVANVQPWGAAGVLHDPETLAARPEEVPGKMNERPFEHPDYHWLRAGRSVVQLEDVTPVDLRDLVAEAAAAGVYAEREPFG